MTLQTAGGFQFGRISRYSQQNEQELSRETGECLCLMTERASEVSNPQALTSAFSRKNTSLSRGAACLRLKFLLKQWIMGDYQGCKKLASLSPLRVPERKLRRQRLH